jgi:hypothetical protein
MLALSLATDPSYGWLSATTLCLFVAALVGFVLFAVNELYWAQMPLLDIRLFLQPTFARGSIGYFFFGWSLAVIPPFLSIFFQDSLYLDPIISGLRNLPFLLGEALIAMFTGKYVAATGEFGIE